MWLGSHRTGSIRSTWVAADRRRPRRGTRCGGVAIRARRVLAGPTRSAAWSATHPGGRHPTLLRHPGITRTAWWSTPDQPGTLQDRLRVLVESLWISVFPICRADRLRCGQRPVDPTPVPFATHRAAPDPRELSTPDRFQAACTDHLSITLRDPPVRCRPHCRADVGSRPRSPSWWCHRRPHQASRTWPEVDGPVHTTQRDSRWKVDVDDQRPSLSDHDRLDSPALNPCSVSASMSPGAWSCPRVFHSIEVSSGRLGSGRRPAPPGREDQRLRDLGR